MNKEQREAIRDAVKELGVQSVVEFAESFNKKFKRCPLCEKTKNESNFYKRDYHRDKNGKVVYYLSGYCKPCMSIASNKKGE